MWRVFAAIATALACANAWASAELMLREALYSGRWATIGAGLAAPAVINAIAGRIATRNAMTLTTGVLEGAAIAMGMTAAALGVRYYFSGGAPLSHPISFVETGVHISVWPLAAVLIAARSRRDARRLRAAAGTALGALALVTSAAMSMLWLNGYWEQQPASTAPAPFQYEGLGFALPAIFFWLSWHLAGPRLKCTHARRARRRGANGCGLCHARSHPPRRRWRARDPTRWWGRRALLWRSC